MKTEVKIVKAKKTDRGVRTTAPAAEHDDRSMSAKIADGVEREQQAELQMLKEKINVQRLSEIVAEGRPVRGKSRLKAHRGQLTDRKDRSVARRKVASRSRARNRK